MADPFRFRTLHRVIGAFVLAALAVVLAGVVLVGRSRHWFERSVVLTLAVPAKDFGLLRPGLPVKMLGAPAGEVVSIEPELAQARLEVARSFAEALRADAAAVIRTPVAGLLGESFVELVPGTGTVPLGNGVALTLRPQEDLLADARLAVANVAAMAAQLRDLVAENRGAVQQALAAMRQGLDRLDGLAQQVGAVVEENRGGMKATVANAAEASARLPAAIAAATDAAHSAGAAADSVGGAADEAAATIAENRPGLRLGTDALAPLLAKLDRVSADLGTITGQISSGEGSVGKLVMESTAHDRLVEATDNLNQRIAELKPLLSSITDMRLYIGVEGGGNLDTGYLAGSAYLRLEPKPWKFYEGGASYRTAPRNHGSANESAGGLPVDFNLVLGWRWLERGPRRYLLSAAAGAIESRIGGWVDVSLLPAERLTLRVLVRDKWDDRDRDERRFEEGRVLVRATAVVRLWQRVFVVAGGDDLADAPAGWAGLRLELLDNDIRNLSQAAVLVH
jgi:ABC-type transporter Mla subunit MlaD